MAFEYGSEEGYEAWKASRQERIEHHRAQAGGSAKGQQPEVVRAPSLAVHEDKFFEQRVAERTEALDRAATFLTRLDAKLGLV